MHRIAWAWFALLPLLGGCVAFRYAPVAPPRCDPNLAGYWTAADEGLLEGAGETSIRVDAACTVQLRDPQDGRRLSFNALGFDHHGQQYLTLAAADVLALMRFQRNEAADADASAVPAEQKDSVFLLRYRLDGDELHATAPNPDAFGRLVEEGALKGRKESYSVLVQERPRGLRRWLRRDPGLFDKGDIDLDLRLRRLPTTGNGP